MRRTPANPDPFGNGSLSDVAGLRVGHYQRRSKGWQTGTTSIIAPDGIVAAVDVRGGGPGTRETNALDTHNLVDRIHGLCLTGGSAYGLSAADGVMAYLEDLGLGVPVGPDPAHIVPVVPAAVIFDLGRGGAFGNRPTPDFGLRSARAAKTRNIRRGSVGAGTGCVAGGLQGGVGMASRTIACQGQQLTIGALAVVNASGSLINPSTGLPWTTTPALRRPSTAERRSVVAASDPANAPLLNTTIGAVAVDAKLTRPETERLAMAAHDGLARAIRPAHSLTDGDTIFGLSTSLHELGVASPTLVRGNESRAATLNKLFEAAADVFAIACVDALLNATVVGDAPSYGTLCPSAFRATP